MLVNQHGKIGRKESLQRGLFPILRLDDLRDPSG